MYIPSTCQVLSTMYLLSTCQVLSTMYLLSTCQVQSTMYLLSTYEVLSTMYLLSTCQVLSTMYLPSICQVLSTWNLALLLSNELRLLDWRVKIMLRSVYTLPPPPHTPLSSLAPSLSFHKGGLPYFTFPIYSVPTQILRYHIPFHNLPPPLSYPDPLPSMSWF